MTAGSILDELTDEQWDLADRVELVLERADREGLTPSAAAKKAHGSYDDTIAVLNYLVKHQYAHTSGNGAWTRYHRGRPR